jgi:hypothetical protein
MQHKLILLNFTQRQAKRRCERASSLVCQITFVQSRESERTKSQFDYAFDRMQKVKINQHSFYKQILFVRLNWTIERDLDERQLIELNAKNPFPEITCDLRDERK